MHQSQFKKDFDRATAVGEKNDEKFKEFMEGEEGVDYEHVIGEDPNLPDMKLLEKEIRREINTMKLEDPEGAKKYEDFVLKRNEMDDEFAKPADLSELKYYPGSDKGPLPEDDVEAYSQWFIEN